MTTTSIPRRASLPLLLLIMMLGVAAMGQFLQPQAGQQRRADDGFVLERDIPKSFGNWRLVPAAEPLVANPETQAILDRLYSQVLARTYVNADGYRVMLSIAWGEDQRGGLQPHRPEVCYPSQGFVVDTNEAAHLSTPFGVIDARRLTTRQGPRAEPLIYWVTVGGKPIEGAFERRVEELRLLLTGQVADGMIFRVSSVDARTSVAFAEQERFVADLLAALPAEVRRRVSGR